jgi:starch synthase
MVSRLEYQKGVDLIPDAFRQIADLEWQAIILGTGDPALELAVYQLETEFPERVRAAIRFDTALSTRLFGGTDITLIPSRYEPCGLTQMIAMRYGCVPVARATGGLVDTIQDNGDAAENTGFLFEESTPSALAGALKRAIRYYKKSKNWKMLQQNGMRQDFSWDSSASKYMSLYNKLTKSLVKFPGRQQ